MRLKTCQNRCCLATAGVVVLVLAQDVEAQVLAQAQGCLGAQALALLRFPPFLRLKVLQLQEQHEQMESATSLRLHLRETKCDVVEVGRRLLILDGDELVCWAIVSEMTCRNIQEDDDGVVLFERVADVVTKNVKGAWKCLYTTLQFSAAAVRLAQLDGVNLATELTGCMELTWSQS